MLFLISTESIAQQSLDSVLLHFKIALTKSDTTYIDTLKAYELRYADLISECHNRISFYKAYSNYRYNEYADAEVLILQRDSILPLQKKCLSKDHSEIITTHLNIGRSYDYLGNKKKAEEYFIIVNELQSNSKIIGKRFAKRYYDIGDFYAIEGDYKKASLFFERAKNSFSGPDASEEYINILTGKARGLIGESKFNEAKDVLQKTINNSIKLPDLQKINLSFLYDKLSYCHRVLGDYQNAKKSIIKARELIKEGGINELKNARIFASRHAAILKSSGNYDGALEIYSEVKDMFNLMGEDLTLGQISGLNEDIADVYYEKGDYLTALKHYQKGLDILVDFNPTDLLSNPKIKGNQIVDEKYLHRQLGLKARTLFAYAKELISEDYYKASLDAVLKYDTVGQYLLKYNWEEASHQQRITNSNSTYKIGVQSALALYNLNGEEIHIADAHNICSRYKTQLLTRGLSIKNKKKTVLSDTLIDLEKKLLREVNQTESQYLAALVSGDTAIEKIAFEKYMAQKSKLDNFNFKNDIAQHIVESQIREIPPIEELQAGLGDKEAILEYFQSSETIYSFLITKKTITFDLTEVSEIELNQFQDWLVGENTNFNLTSLSSKILKSLLRTNFSSIDKLIIIPDGNLLELPFEALKINDTEYLIEKYNLSYCYATSFIGERPEPESKGFFVGFASDYSNHNDSTMNDFSFSLSKLPYAVDEVNSAKNLMKGKVFVNREATKNKFITVCESANILHLALHSNLNSIYPDQSSLVFESDSTDYFLTASEIYSLDLNTTLTVLSACNSAVGKVNSGDGVRSITRSFIHAGSASVLTTLWEAPDISTYQIIQSFYKGLASGQEKDVALRNAKLDYLHTIQPAYRHPKYWAHLILIGDTSTISIHNNLSIFIIVLSLILALIALYFSSKRIKRIK